MQYNYRRRPSREVRVGNIGIGGDNDIRLQSMTNTPTADVQPTVEQALRIAEAGGELVRVTTQGVREAAAVEDIIAGLREAGCEVPVSADVHFNPKAAFEAARTADKVRINPGNFVDPARTFIKLEFTDEEYTGEIERIRRTLIPFLEECRRNSTAVRLGVNHGSLSDRIMSRYGDTPAGMVESVMEYLRIAREIEFNDIVISIKSSNTSVMVETVRLLVAAMDAAGMDYPLHLGVTEAGDAEDGRIKSAIGIGALLAEGIGDTIRVSLAEDPEREIPVARFLRDYITSREGHEPVEEPGEILQGDARAYGRPVKGMGNVPFAAFHADADRLKFNRWLCADTGRFPADAMIIGEIHDGILLGSRHANPVGDMASWIDRYVAGGGRLPVILNLRYETSSLDDLRVMAAADAGALLLAGYGAGIRVEAPGFSDEELGRLELDILQGAGKRISKTEYIACPSCGRTLFDLQATLREVKDATAGLKGLKIGVMGCIVNGPGEMADADYGYVGAGPGRVSIYRGKELVRKNIPTEEALEALLDLIRSDGRL